MNRKLSAARPELHPISVKTPWYHLGIDFVGPISPSSPTGKQYILTISDYCTKWAAPDQLSQGGPFMAAVIGPGGPFLAAIKGPSPRPPDQFRVGPYSP